jgi:hypothetical protein
MGEGMSDPKEAFKAKHREKRVEEGNKRPFLQSPHMGPERERRARGEAPGKPGIQEAA